MVQSCFLLRGFKGGTYKVEFWPSGGVVNPVLALLTYLHFSILEFPLTCELTSFWWLLGQIRGLWVQQIFKRPTSFSTTSVWQQSQPGKVMYNLLNSYQCIYKYIMKQLSQVTQYQSNMYTLMYFFLKMCTYTVYTVSMRVYIYIYINTQYMIHTTWL